MALKVSFKCIAKRCRLLSLEIGPLHKAILESGLAEVSWRTRRKRRRRVDGLVILETFLYQLETLVSRTSISKRCDLVNLFIILSVSVEESF